MLNPIEPPWYVTRMPGGVRGAEPQGSPLSRSSHALPSIAANRHIEPRKLTTLVAGDLDSTVMRALDKERMRRYDSATGLAEDIQRYLADEPVLARRPTRAIG